MPSPDFSNYVDLKLFDLNSQQIFLNALEYARIALPEFEPVEGSIETVLLEAMAVEVQELATTINRLPNGILQALLALLNVTRQDAVPATGVVRLESAVDTDYEVPAGARLLSPTSALTDSVVLATDEAITMSRDKFLSSVARSSFTVTAKTIARHGLQVGGPISVTMVNVLSTPVSAAAACSGTALTVATVPDDYTFTYTVASSGTITTKDLSDTGSYLSVPASANPYGVVGATAEVPGYAYLAAGTDLQVLTASRQIGSVSMHSDLDGGINAENDSDYFARSSATLNRMTSALVTAPQIAQYVASSSKFKYAYRVAAVDLADIDRVTPASGSTLVYVAKIGATETNQIENDDLLAIEDDIAPYVHPSLSVVVDNFYFANIGVAVTVIPRPDFTSTEIEAAISTALTEYMNPDTWDLSNVIYHTDIASAILNATLDGELVVRSVTTIMLTIGTDNSAGLRAAGLNYTLTEAGNLNDNVTFDDLRVLVKFDPTDLTVEYE